MHKYKEEWILCPICENKTRARIRQDTKLSSLLSNMQKRKFD